MCVTLVRAFWQAMNDNDWTAVAARFLAPDFALTWPQTGEVIGSPAEFVAVNAAFPGQGGWRFEVVALTGAGDQAASDTRITHAALGVTARALTFHLSRGGLIAAQTEFWPDPYPVPEWRRGLLTVDPGRARF